MEVLKKELEVGKELADVVDLVVALIVDIKAKKSIAEITAGILPEVMTAVNGFQDMDDEARAVGAETGAWAASEIFKALKA